MWPAIIGAGASLLGGLLGKSSADDAREQAAENLDRQIQLQKEFAQNGIRWKVEDAKQAGIHPLYALGAQTTSFSPISLTNPADNSMANSVSNMGQDISRAVHQTRTPSEKDQAYIDAARGLQLEKGKLDVEIARADLASRTARLYQGTTASMPSLTGNMIPGQGNSPFNPAQIIQQSFPTGNVSENKSMPDVGYTETSRGLYPVPGKDVKERIEDNLPHELAHFFRNNILPIFGENMNPGSPAKAGHHWVYHPIYGYRQVKTEAPLRYKGWSNSPRKAPPDYNPFNPYQ